MTIKSSGNPLNLTEIQTEFGGVVPISLSEYYGLASGLPTSGQPINMSTYYGKTFIVVEQITSNVTWAPKLNKSRFMHIFVIGAGGSGGHGWAASNVGIFGTTDGVAGGAGGGAGGVSYSILPGSTSGSANIGIGVGGVGVSVGGGQRSIDGNSGSSSSFVGLGLNMIAQGGAGGEASQATSGGGDSTSGLGGTGGSASGGNTLNLLGGSGGGYSVSGSDVRKSGAGGGAPRFLAGHNGTAQSSTTENTTSGAKVSLYGTYPVILTSYISNKAQTPILGASITSFDGSDGNISSGRTGTPLYAGGSGGSGVRANNPTGNGGNGLVIIVYEI